MSLSPEPQAQSLLQAIERLSTALLEAAQQQRFADLERLLDERQQLLETFFSHAREHAIDVQQPPLGDAWGRVADLNVRASGAVIAAMAQLRKSLRKLGARRKARSAYPAASPEAQMLPSGLNLRG